MYCDPIADLLTRIRNANSAGHTELEVPSSKQKSNVLKVLHDEGFIAGMETSVEENKAVTTVRLKSSTGRAVISEINRVSKPGRRVYVGKDEIPTNRGGLGIYVLSTPKGVISDKEARKLGVGGELICSVF